MDLIFKRYSSPFLIINEMIINGQLLKFINKILDIQNDERVYDIWLHRVFDKSFEQFKEGLDIPSNSMPSRKNETVNVNEVVKKSLCILDDIKPL